MQQRLPNLNVGTGPTRRALLAFSSGALLLAALPALAQQLRSVEPVTIQVRSKPIPHFDVRDPSRRQFGLLQFRGGIELTSPTREFGGISSLRVERDGSRFLAVTDKGQWLRGRIRYQGDTPTGIDDAEMAPILGPDGRPITARGWYDSEGLTEDGGTVYVAFERVHQIVRFDYGKNGLGARGQPIKVPPEFKALPSNKGIEGLVVVPKGIPLAGTLIALSERAEDEVGNIRAFLLAGPTPGAFSVKRSGDFDITDAAITPGGDLLILERRFSVLRGAGMRLRRLPLAGIEPGETVDGPALFEADAGYQIDNMEALSVHRSASGDTVLTLVSDDNFSQLQRTLLLQFTLTEP